MLKGNKNEADVPFSLLIFGPKFFRVAHKDVPLLVEAKENAYEGKRG